MMRTARTRKERVKRIEFHLRNYHQYLAAIQIIERHARVLHSDILPNITASYDLREGTAGTFIVRSSTEDAALRRIERGAMPPEMAAQKAKYELIAESIEVALDRLNNQERWFIERRYFADVSIVDLADEMQASPTFVYDIRNSVFDKLLISLSAIEDL